MGPAAVSRSFRRALDESRPGASAEEAAARGSGKRRDSSARPLAAVLTLFRAAGFDAR